MKGAGGALEDEPRAFAVENSATWANLGLATCSEWMIATLIKHRCAAHYEADENVAVKNFSRRQKIANKGRNENLRDSAYTLDGAGMN